MILLCGLFVPLQSLPPPLQAVARVLPLTSYGQRIHAAASWDREDIPAPHVLRL